MKENTIIYNTYLYKFPRTVIRYTIVGSGLDYKIKKRYKETFFSSTDAIEKILYLEENGYRSIDIVTSILDEKKLKKLFAKKYSDIEDSKELKLIF